MGLSNPFTAGGRITVATMAAAVPLAAFKYTDQNSGPSNTTLTNDNDLSLSLAASGVYTGYGMIVYSSSPAANYNATLTAPLGATGGWSPNLYLGINNLVPNDVFNPFGTVIGLIGTGSAQLLSYAFQFSVVMGAAAGTLQYQFAQRSSDANNCWTRAGSFLLAWKIA